MGGEVNGRQQPTPVQDPGRPGSTRRHPYAGPMPRYRQLRPYPGDLLAVCEDCGAAVRDEITHDRWHTDLAASQTPGMNGQGHRSL